MPPPTACEEKHTHAVSGWTEPSCVPRRVVWDGVLGGALIRPTGGGVPKSRAQASCPGSRLGS